MDIGERRLTMNNRINMGVFCRVHRTIRILIWARKYDDFGDVWLERHPDGEDHEYPAKMEYRILNNICWRNSNSDTTVKLRWANGEIDNI